MSVKIRFVGGPWHNKLMLMSELVPYWRVPMPRPVPLFADLNKDITYEDVCFEIADYQLMQFRSEFGTVYDQYICTNIIHNRTPERSVFDEQFTTGFHINTFPLLLIAQKHRLGVFR